MTTKRKYLHLTRRKKSKIIIHTLKKKIKKNKTMVREVFTVSNGMTLSWLKLEILKLQTQLAVALREGNTDCINRYIKIILRSKFTQEFAVYKTIFFSEFRSKNLCDKKDLTTRFQYTSLRTNLWYCIKKPNSYQAKPLKNFRIQKNNLKELRVLSLPNYLDRSLQYLYLIILEVISEEFADNNSFGFRLFRSPGWAAKALILQIVSRANFGPPKFALELNINECFDSISHEFIENLFTKYKFSNNIIEIIHPNIITQWLKCGFIDLKRVNSPKNQKIPTESNIFQGNPISPTIFNMVLDGLEPLIVSKIKLDNLDIQNITTYDNVVWVYNSKEVLCSFSIGIFDLIIINQALRDLGYYFINSMVKQVYLGFWIYKKGSWSYKIINKDSSFLFSKNFINDYYVSVIRYADDIVILFNSLSVEKKILNIINEFFLIRKLKVSQQKTCLKFFYLGEKINFVGYEFVLVRRKNIWKVFNYPPGDKIKNIKRKVDDIYNTYNYQIYSAFYLVNLTLRCWLNFYRTANSKTTFRKLHEWLFKRTYKYLTIYLRKNSKYKISSQRYDKKLLSYDLWNTFYYNINYFKSKWFGIPSSLNFTFRCSRIDLEPYMLISPKSIKISTPSILIGLNAFHPKDRVKLNLKAIYWRPCLLSDLLIKSKGKCKRCSSDLLDNFTNIEVMPLNLIGFKEKQKLMNFSVFCRECYKDLTYLVKTKNFEQILLYEQNKLLFNVFDILFSFCFQG